MVDGCHTRARRIESPRLTGGVNSYYFPYTRGFVNSRGQFGLGVLIRRRKMTARRRVFPRLVDFDEIRAFFELLADHPDQFVSTIRIGCVRKHMLFRVEVVGVFMSAEDIDRIPADA